MLVARGQPPDVAVRFIQWFAPFLSEFPEKTSAVRVGAPRHPRAGRA
jgi:hypothetical protein